MKLKEPENMGRVTVEVELANHADMVLMEAGHLKAEQVRRVRIKGVVDTGASHLVLPKKVADRLGVPEVGTANVRFADQRKAKRTVVNEVNLALLGREGSFKAIVEPKREDALIGAIVLEDLDLVVDCRTQTVHPRDPNQIIAEIE